MWTGVELPLHKRHEVWRRNIIRVEKSVITGLSACHELDVRVVKRQCMARPNKTTGADVTSDGEGKLVALRTKVESVELAARLLIGLRDLLPFLPTVPCVNEMHGHSPSYKNAVGEAENQHVDGAATVDSWGGGFAEPLSVRARTKPRSKRSRPDHCL